MSEEHATYGATSNPLDGKPCLLPFADPDYEPPTPEDIKAAVQLSGLSQTGVAKLVGVSYHPDKGSNSVRRWQLPKEHAQHRDMPYAAWRLLLIYVELVKAITR